MKKLTISISLVLISALWVVSKAQSTELKGAAGVEFGSTKEIVKSMMRTKHSDATFTEDKNNTLYYVGGSWANREVAMWGFIFTSTGKLHTIAIIVDPEHDADIFELYDNVVTDISSKYGEPKTDDVYEFWKYPYTARDKYDHGVTALRNGLCDMSTFFWFPGSDGGFDNGKNSIYVQITDNINVVIKYQDGILAKEISKNRESKKISDM